MGALPQIKYVGQIREVKLGKSGSEVVVGGETGYNFYSFEARMPHSPKLALQVLDTEPEEWATEALEPFKDVLGDPVAWAKKCVEQFNADLVCLWLAGTDPNGMDLSAEHAADVALKVAQAIDVPLIVWGVSSDEKNTAVLKAVAETCTGLNLVLGPVTENNYKQVGAAAIAYKHIVAANSPIDINLAKQLNILLENLGVPNDRIVIDPTTGAVGYGLEYCYSIMERIRQAALTQNDEKLQYPIINNIAEEIWKTKEAKLRREDDPRLGDPAIRGVSLEAVTALSALQAGSDILILRHPKTLEHLRRYLSDIMIETDLDSMAVDLSLVVTPQEPSGEAKGPKAPSAPKETAKVEPAPSVSVPQPDAPQPAEPSIPEPSVSKEAEAEKAPPAAPAPSEDQEAAAGPPDTEVAVPRTPSTSASSTVELTDEDIEALREMLAAFRAIRNLFAGLSRFMAGGS